MCGPVLIGHGTPEQKAHYLPRMLSGEDFWCQGYSEPGSGSDLASLQMSARDDGDHFVCNGHKIWTTHANCRELDLLPGADVEGENPAARHHLPADRHDDAGRRR